MKSRRMLFALSVLLAPLVSRAADLDRLLYEATQYGSTSEKQAVKAAAREELLRQMPESLRTAMKYIHGDNVGVNVITMEWVESQPDEVVIPVMLEFLADPKPETRRLAIFFLGFKNGAVHAEKIMTHLNDEETRGAVLRTLGKWKIASARAEMEKALGDKKERIRIVAANALRDAGDPAAIPALLGALEDPVFTVRHAAARAIIKLGADESSLRNARSGSSVSRLVDRIRADAGLITPEEALEDDTLFLEGKFF